MEREWNSFFFRFRYETVNILCHIRFTSGRAGEEGKCVTFSLFSVLGARRNILSSHFLTDYVLERNVINVMIRKSLSLSLGRTDKHQRNRQNILIENLLEFETLSKVEKEASSTSSVVTLLAVEVLLSTLIWHSFKLVRDTRHRTGGRAALEKLHKL